MKYHFRTPELVPTLVMLLVVGLMFSLSFWQFQRLQWKNALLADIEAAQSQPPKELAAYPVESLNKAEWHNVTVTGTLLHDKELYATPRYYKEQLGYAVLTPLVFPTASGPRYALINRGWVPPEKKDPKTRMQGNSNGLVMVMGVIRNPMAQGAFRPDNNPGKNLWFWYDIKAMGKQVELPLLPVFIDATDVRPADGAAYTEGPLPFPLEIKIRNDHLGYALTWLMIGLSGVIMFGIYYLEPKKST